MKYKYIFEINCDLQHSGHPAESVDLILKLLYAQFLLGPCTMLATFHNYLKSLSWKEFDI